ncbi:MAG: M67 family metallopeptidase [Lachnospiraceae bacterium]|nr:M67 family metallopeptidase [Lachnospiraceae bacterium]
MLYILKEDYFKIIKHCIDCLPYEACGLAGGIKCGGDKYIQKIYLLTNTESSIDHFTMDIKEQFAAVKDMRKNGMQMAGNFHSHPSAPALLSEEDKRLAYDFNTSYMVLSLMDASFPVLKAYKIDKEKNVTEEIINIVNKQDYHN